MPNETNKTNETLLRMKELIPVLDKAARAYYQDGQEIMPNIEYDRLYDELRALEQKTGIVLAGSPTQKVGYEVLSALPKERHAAPMLSLDKTKSVDDLVSWLGNQRGILSWKMDGLTIVLTYKEGKLQKAVTRGNGEIGEVITQNAMQFENLPGQIPFEGELILRGEAVISYADFAKINEEIPDADARYKNPRNLCSGSVRQLDPAITRARHVNLVAFTLVSAEGVDFENSFAKQFDWLASQGFTVVEHVAVDGKSLPDAVKLFQEKITKNKFPSDGLVLALDDLAYGKSLGRTAKFPRNMIAFKWKDETAETILREIEWSASRTGLINPVAVFDPVELEGTTVSRASVHNVSIVRELKLGIGDRITVYKANMIIPQIAENLSKSGRLEIPAHCPVCGGETEIRQEGDAACLYCTNPACPAKKIKSFVLMASRDALNIEGLSEMTLEKFISEGFIHEYADLFHLDRYREKIVEMDGFGEKSYENLIAAARRAATTDLYRVLYGLGIPGIGLSGAKLICRAFLDDVSNIENAKEEQLTAIDGIGPVLAASFVAYFADAQNRAQAEQLLAELKLRPDAFLEEAKAQQALEAAGEKLELQVGEKKLLVRPNALLGKTFVITGDVHIFQNRRAVQDLIERLGGKAAGSVSKKTDFLINNDAMSSSSKNKKAKELSIPILTEEEFLARLAES